MLLLALLCGLILRSEQVPADPVVAGISVLSTSFEVHAEELARVQVTTAHREERSILSAQERQVSFWAFNETFDLNLLPASNLLSTHFSVLLRKEEEGVETIPSDQFAECLYRGPTAALSLCRDVRGIVVLSANEFLSIEPASRHARSSDTGEELHLIKRMAWKPRYSPIVGEAKRNKRSPNIGRKTQITVETAIFVDAYLYKHMAVENFPDDVEREMTHFVLTMMNAVQLLYQDDSLGYDIHFQVQRLEMWSHQPVGLAPSQAISSFTIPNSSPKKAIYDIDRYLNRFCHWQGRRNPHGDQDPNHWDHALLLTGLDLFALGRDGVTSHQIVGLAPIGGMCTSTSSCTVNEGRHFESVHVVAHEIGHNLGMKHDGQEAGNDCDSGSFLMSPTLGSGKTQWSPCSRHYLDSFLNTPQASCLFDSSWIPERLDHDNSGIFPGERYSADEQCMLRHGKRSRKSSQGPLNEICRDLRCTNVSPRVNRQTSSGISQYTSHPALEGTACGHNMWCRRGRCSDRPKFEKNDGDSDGGTDTSWRTTNPCASGCLYGEDFNLTSGSMAITTQMQSCKSGAYCNPGAIRYQTCDGSQVCAQINRTTIQQYTDDICARASQQNSSILARGLQQTSADAFRSCQVWCYLRSGGLVSAAGWMYPDGTRCQTSHDTEHYGRRSDGTVVNHFCIAGRCQEFSCNEETPFQLHSSHCRSEDAAESNVIYDYPVQSNQHNLVGARGEKFSAPHRASQLQNLVLFSPSAHMERIAAAYRESYFNPSDRFQQMRSNGLLVDSFVTLNSSRITQITWKAISSCRSGCLTSSKGLRLVRRECESSYCDSNHSNNVQLCIPNEQECPLYQPISTFANQVCHLQLWSDQHRGFQIWSPTVPDKACTVHCRDKHTNDLLPVQGESGWFPSGTLCDRRRSAYCVSGRCVEFDEHGVPIMA